MGSHLLASDVMATAEKIAEKNYELCRLCSHQHAPLMQQFSKHLNHHCMQKNRLCSHGLKNPSAFNEKEYTYCPKGRGPRSTCRGFYLCVQNITHIV